MNNILNAINALPTALIWSAAELVVLFFVAPFATRVYVALRFLKQYEKAYKERHK